MATLHSNKENLVNFQGLKTPSRKGRLALSNQQNRAFKTPNENTYIKFPSKEGVSEGGGAGRIEPLKTPGTTRIPLGGKDKNVHPNKGSEAKQIAQKQGIGSSTVKRQTLSQRKLTPRTPVIVNSNPVKTPVGISGGNIESNVIQSEPQAQHQPFDYGYVDVETIPPKPVPVLDLPLDHIDLDYDYISRATKTVVFVDKPKKSRWDDLDLPWEELIDKNYDIVSLPDLKVEEDENDDNSSHSFDTTVMTSPPPNARRPMVASTLASSLTFSLPPPSSSIPLVSRRRVPDYMAPTKSAQAKRRGDVLSTRKPEKPNPAPSVLSSTTRSRTHTMANRGVPPGHINSNQMENLPSEFEVSTDEIALSLEL